MRAKLREVNDQLKQRRHQPVPEQGQWLASVVRGHCAYYAVPGNTDAVAALRTQAARHWLQGAAASQPAPHQLGPDEPPREPMATIRPRDASLPGSALCHQDLRQEPSAVVSHAGICAGGLYRDRQKHPARPTRTRWCALV
jgi:hypothetical protein